MLRLKARGQRDPVTVVGHAAMISACEWIQAAGTWINDRTHGLQFRANFLKATPPTTLDDIERYLGSGMICGIGPGLRQAPRARLRQSRVRRHRGRPVPPARGRRHRPRAGASPPAGPSRRLCATSCCPARPRRRTVPGRADLQDLRRRGRGGDQREPLPPRARHAGASDDVAEAANERSAAFIWRAVLPRQAHVSRQRGQDVPGTPRLVGPFYAIK